jgi:glycosyltransferase involved in cell wall biosynthesis
MLIAASSRPAAELYRERCAPGAEIVDRFDLVSARCDLGALASDGEVEEVVIHSLDWRREDMPQLYLLAAGRSRARSLRLVDEADGRERPIRRREILTALPELAAGTGAALAEIARAELRPRPRAPRVPYPEPRSVVAVWSGSSQSTVGGSVTHAAGILGAFRSVGLRVVLLSEAEPPSQIESSIDDLHRLPSPPQRWRATRDVRRLTANRTLRTALMEAVTGLEAPFLYARHQPLASAPSEVAGSAGVPLVLEWNASERWAQDHWTRAPGGLKRVTLPLIGRFERGAVAGSSVIAAVSSAAAAMAIEAGAAPERVIVTPNAVDPEEIDRIVAGAEAPAARGEGPLVGWIGSFGEWHGAEAVVRAAGLVADSVRFRMIGDGIERPGCEALAGDLGVRERVEFLGRRPHEEALRLLSACDVLVSPNVPLRTGEPFFGSPTKIFEYMALRRPIVASELGQIGEVLTNGGNARLIEPGSAEELAAGIEELIAAPPLAAELAANARREVELDHTWVRRAEAILTALVRG